MLLCMAIPAPLATTTPRLTQLAFLVPALLLAFLVSALLPALLLAFLVSALLPMLLVLPPVFPVLQPAFLELPLVRRLVQMRMLHLRQRPSWLPSLPATLRR